MLKLDGAKLKNARLDKGWSQQEAATAAGVAEPTYIRAERGDVIQPSTGRCIAEALGLLLADVRDRSDDDAESLASPALKEEVVRNGDTA